MRVGLITVLVAAAAAPHAFAHGSFPAHDPGRVVCGTNALTGAPQLAVAVPDRFLGARAASERVAFRPRVYRWNGSSWALYRTGVWAYTQTSAGGSPIAGAPAYSDRNGNRITIQTFSPVDRGHYAVLVQFWWSSTQAIHGMWANEYRGVRAYLTYCSV